MREINVAATDEAVSAQVGDRLVVALGEPSTTGFRWEIDARPDCVELVADERLPAPRAPGAAGERRFTFAVRATGDGPLLLVLRQPWSGEVADTVSTRVSAR